MKLPNNNRQLYLLHKRRQITPGMTVWCFNGLTARIQPYQAILGNDTVFMEKNPWPNPDPRERWFLYTRYGNTNHMIRKYTDTRTIVTDEDEAWLLYEQELTQNIQALEQRLANLKNHYQDVCQQKQSRKGTPPCQQP